MTKFLFFGMNLQVNQPTSDTANSIYERLRAHGWGKKGVAVLPLCSRSELKDWFSGASTTSLIKELSKTHKIFDAVKLVIAVWF